MQGRPDRRTRGAPAWLRLAGGILGRADDMIHVRGNNLYPAAIEAIVRRFPEVAEYRIVVDHTGPLADLRIEVEPARGRTATTWPRPSAGPSATSCCSASRCRLAAPGTLPRFEMKAAASSTV